MTIKTVRAKLNCLGLGSSSTRLPILVNDDEQGGAVRRIAELRHAAFAAESSYFSVGHIIDANSYLPTLSMFAKPCLYLTITI